MQKLLVIGGTTASGKTELALELAQHYNGELICADSRQVYKSMDIGTGKDLPVNSKFNLVEIINYGGQDYQIGFYLYDQIKLWLYDCASPQQDFSVAAWDFLARRTIDIITKPSSNKISPSKLPIIIGGTGLYIRTLLNPPETLHIPQNKNLRQEFSDLSVDQLQMQLIIENEQRFKRMNPSDKNNPRRLIRAIEVSHWQRSHSLISQNPSPKFDYLLIGLNLSKSVLAKKISHRVNKRLEAGFLDEVKSLNLKGLSDRLPAKNTLGYSQMLSYLDHQLDFDSAKAEWIQKEIAYSKRQLTFFKKIHDIHWHILSNPDSKPEIESLVSKWYSG
jgi:tRNA dimethylallyltransferase